MTLDRLSQITEVGIKSGITLRNINVEGAYVSGIVTASSITIVGSGITVTGVITATSFNGDGSALTGIAATTNVRTNSLVVSGVSTLGNTVVGGATTQLVVNGNARITGILTVGTSSITFNGNDNSVTIGTGVTVFGNTGIVSATEFRGNGSNLTGVGAFAAGTAILFSQAAAPTGWTKQTTHNDKALRVVNGTGGGSGGTTAFTSVFASRTPAGTVSGTNTAGSVSNTTLSTNEMPSHSHSITTNYSFYSGSRVTSSDGSYTNHTGGTNAAGSSGAHGHGFTNPTWSGTFSGSSMDFAVQYVDVIICTKD